MVVFVLFEIVNYYLERDLDVYVVFLDNEKVFNSVWYVGLFYKLFYIGINGKGWCLFVDLFQNMIFCIFYEGKMLSNYIMR